MHGNLYIGSRLIRSANLHGPETIVTVKFRGLKPVRYSVKTQEKTSEAKAELNTGSLTRVRVR